MQSQSEDLDSRTASFLGKRSKDSSRASSASLDSPRSNKRKRDQISSQDVRDFVPAGGSFSGAPDASEQQVTSNSGDMIMAKPQGSTQSSEEGEIHDSTDVASGSDDITEGGVTLGQTTSTSSTPKSAVAPAINWNTGAKSGIRTTLGGGAARPRLTLGGSKGLRAVDPNKKIPSASTQISIGTTDGSSDDKVTGQVLGDGQGPQQPVNEPSGKDMPSEASDKQPQGEISEDGEIIGTDTDHDDGGIIINVDGIANEAQQLPQFDGGSDVKPSQTPSTTTAAANVTSSHPSYEGRELLLSNLHRSVKVQALQNSLLRGFKLELIRMLHPSQIITGDDPGFAHVVLSSPAEAQRAVKELNGKKWTKRKIVIRYLGDTSIMPEPQEVVDNVVDMEGDAMLSKYSDSNQMKASNPAICDPPPELAPVVERMDSIMSAGIPVAAVQVMVKDLDMNQKALQKRYFGLVGRVSTTPHPSNILQPVDVDNPEALPVCTACAAQGHIANTCPTLTCKHCQVQSHRSAACPTIQKCPRCHEPGHTIDTCSYKLAPSADELSLQCDLCGSTNHDDSVCPDLWRTFDYIAPNMRTVRHLAIYCARCSADTHFYADCPLRPSAAPPRTGRLTWSTYALDRFLDPAAPRPNTFAPKGFNIHGRSAPERVPLDSDADDDAGDPAAFYRGKAARHKPPPPQRSHIRFDGGPRGPPPPPVVRGWTSINDLDVSRSSGDRWEPIDSYSSGPRDGRYRERDDPRHYAPPDRDRRRSRSPPTGPRYDRRGGGGDSWQPPLPNEPVPPPVRGGGGGGGGGGGRGKKKSNRGGRVGRGGGGGPPIHRPMPSAAKNAWVKHRA